MNPSKLTEKEALIYKYITETIRECGYSPSVRDIQSALGIKSTSTVHSYIARLEAKGFIHKENGKSRTLRVEGAASEPKHTVKVPLLGCVRAGMPILATENHEGYIDFPLINRRYENEQLFALRVQGESMIEAGILDGDIIIVKSCRAAENGEIVVALLDDEATVKTFYKENGRFRLQPENSSMEPIYTDSVYILGKVISSMRFYF